jgi:8-oxo-dGTP diphosphatase
MINCVFENGNKASLRHVTVNAIVIKDGKVLLGKRGSLNGKPISESGKWGLLGGFFDRDESLAQAVKREVMEESGWEINNLKLLRINDNPNRPKEDRQNVDFVFIVSAIKQVKTSDEEVKELKWFPFEKLPPKNLIAFDHGDALELYVKYLKENIKLPIVG